MKKYYFIEHKDLTRAILDQIIDVKSIAWPYNYEQQLNWINNNIKSNDIHLMVFKNNNIQAYLNLIKITIDINGKPMSGIGIGNVCVSDKSKGLGKFIMRLANNFIHSNNQIGLLFCKKHLLNFYQKQDWLLVRKDYTQIPPLEKDVLVFIYNYNHTFNKLKYSGRLF